MLASLRVERLGRKVQFARPCNCSTFWADVRLLEELGVRQWRQHTLPLRTIERDIPHYAVCKRQSQQLVA